MSQTPEFSEAKPALLEKYLRGELTQTSTAARAITQRVQESPPPSTDSRAPLVPLQTDGSNRPFFYLHVHWVGSAFYSFIVARDLGSNQPFYVLDPYKFDGLRVPPTIEAMATSYIESIRSVQPEGHTSWELFAVQDLLLTRWPSNFAQKDR